MTTKHFFLYNFTRFSPDWCVLLSFSEEYSQKYNQKKEEKGKEEDKQKEDKNEKDEGKKKLLKLKIT